MGISIFPTESPLEREQRIRQSTTRRIRILAAVTIMMLGARFLVKDPPPPKVAVHDKSVIEVRPGMLRSLPASERAKLDPQLLARMQLADENALLPKAGPETAVAKAPEKYHAPDAPVSVTSEEDKQLAYSYVKKRERLAERRELAAQSVMAETRTMLVLFRSGGAFTAEEIRRNGSRVEIVMDKTLVAQIPDAMVRSVSDDALSWKEPVRPGYVRIKPARGITITLPKEVSRRVRQRKGMYEES